jgi:hypothetical protein
MTNEGEPPPGTFVNEAWSPRDYARRYYPAGRVGRENRALIDSLVSIWHQIGRLDVPRDIERLPGNEGLALLAGHGEPVALTSGGAGRSPAGDRPEAARFRADLGERGFDLLYLRWIPAAPGEATEDDYEGHIVCAAQKHPA